MLRPGYEFAGVGIPDELGGMMLFEMLLEQFSIGGFGLCFVRHGVSFSDLDGMISSMHSGRRQDARR
jgi:hypothetical protein